MSERDPSAWILSVAGGMRSPKGDDDCSNGGSFIFLDALVGHDARKISGFVLGTTEDTRIREKTRNDQTDDHRESLDATAVSLYSHRGERVSVASEETRGIVTDWPREPTMFAQDVRFACFVVLLLLFQNDASGGEVCPRSLVLIGFGDGNIQDVRIRAVEAECWFDFGENFGDGGLHLRRQLHKATNDTGITPSTWRGNVTLAYPGGEICTLRAVFILSCAPGVGKLNSRIPRRHVYLRARSETLRTCRNFGLTQKNRSTRSSPPTTSIINYKTNFTIHRKIHTNTQKSPSYLYIHATGESIDDLDHNTPLLLFITHARDIYYFVMQWNTS